MPIYKDENNYKVIKLDSGNQPQDYDLPQDTDIATEQEMRDYILNMTAPNVSANGNDLIIDFTPFPQRYINYIQRKQYNGRRTQVFWQLVRYVGKTVARRTNVFASESISPGWRDDETNDLYHWTFPTRGMTEDGTMEPYHFNMTPKQAKLGRIVWAGGYGIINRFSNRPYLVVHNIFPRKIAFIIGVAHHGMVGNVPWTYKKSNDFEYNDDGPIIPLAELIASAELTLEKDGNDYFLSFSNINPQLLNYAEVNMGKANCGLMLQVFDYYGGQTHGCRRGDPALRKEIKSPSKPREYRLNIGSSALTDGIYISQIMQMGEINVNDFHKMKSRYKYESETFHHISVALVLKNLGMNDGFHTYKESNKVNILE